MMKKTFPIALLVILLLGGCGGASTESFGGPTPSKSEPEISAVVAENVLIPNVVGMKLDVAREKISQADLKTITKAANGKPILAESNWTVLSQSPAAGARVTPGTLVELTVGKETVSSQTPAPVPLVPQPPANPAPVQQPVQPVPQPAVPARHAAPEPAPQPADGAVTPGAFCSGQGSTGYSKKGVLMICTSDGKRNRWKAA